MDQGLAGFIRCFAVPKAALPVIDVIVSPTEQKTLQVLAGRTFTEDEAALLTAGAGVSFDGGVVKLYRRGLIVQTETEGRPCYRISDFYGRLDIFVRGEFDTYRSFGEEIRRNLDAWYFNAYYSRLDIRPEKGPSMERTLSLDETLEFIENENRQAYLALCDCRVLAGGLYGNCGKPMETCVSYRSGPNTLADRGISRPVSREYVKKTIKAADRAGLMHRVGSSDICNCCGECCYMNRAREQRNREIHLYEDPNGKAPWPYNAKRVRVNTSACAGCGTCTRRCPLKLFTVKNGVASTEPCRCAGCGLCVSTCTTGSLVLVSFSNEVSHDSN
jgi:ferredoxin